MKIIDYLKKISARFFPHICVLCGRFSHRPHDLCEPCLRDLPYSSHACSICARPSAAIFAEHLSKSLSKSLSIPHLLSICEICSSCPPSFDSSYALFLYQFPITKLIMNLKFGHSLTNARLFGEILYQKIHSEWYHNKTLPECIIPMPLHSQRLKERGFNQALEIARPIAKSLRLPIEYKQCHRIKTTAAQATLAAQNRRRNIKNAFHIDGQLNYQYVAVLDDVITTGQTMNEFCNTLKLAGIQKIDVWCCARPQLKVGRHSPSVYNSALNQSGEIYARYHHTHATT